MTIRDSVYTYGPTARVSCPTKGDRIHTVHYSGSSVTFFEGEVMGVRHTDRNTIYTLNNTIVTVSHGDRIIWEKNND